MERIKTHEAQETDSIAEIIYMTDIAKRALSPEQTEYFRSQAAYWAEVQEMAEKQLEYATSQRAYALQMLGMLPNHGGYPE